MLPLIFIFGGNMHGRRPVRTEWKIFEYYGLDSREWLVQKATDTFFQVVHRDTGEIKILNLRGE